MQDPESGAQRKPDPLVEPTEAGELTGPGATPVIVPETLGQQEVPPEPSRVRWVVVVTRAATEAGAGGPALVTRFWQPRDGRWVEQIFESLEHAVHLFVDEYGWILRQQQPLDAPEAYELIFETHSQELSQPSAAEVLEEEVGLTPGDVAELLQRVDERVEGETGSL